MRNTWNSRCSLSSGTTQCCECNCLLSTSFVFFSMLYCDAYWLQANNFFFWAGIYSSFQLYAHKKKKNTNSLFFEPGNVYIETQEKILEEWEISHFYKYLHRLCINTCIYRCVRTSRLHVLIKPKVILTKNKCRPISLKFTFEETKVLKKIKNTISFFDERNPWFFI